MDSGFHNQQPGFWITIMVGFRIPKPWIPDSTDQNYLDSGFQITLDGAKHKLKLDSQNLLIFAVTFERPGIVNPTRIIP